ncbi:scale keratin-like [Manacus vitellinus]|uniref:scale keratin-like n=1 Tax=Manacus vitellinus TaxID=328815 RepID=UPI00115CFCB3|nr:scale keratin-like [Manacus vitellinus]
MVLSRSPCTEGSPSPCGVAAPQPVAESCNEPCVRQCPDSTVVIYPPPVVVTFPGPILSTFPQQSVVGSAGAPETQPPALLQESVFGGTVSQLMPLLEKNLGKPKVTG